MKFLQFVLVFLLFAGLNTSCSAQNDEGKENGSVQVNENVEVYYFHFTRRCATCKAIEDVSKETVAEYNDKKVSFKGYNLDEESGKAAGKELNVSGQTLLIVAGNHKINLTNEGFMNARTNPDKLKALIKQNIDAQL